MRVFSHPEYDAHELVEFTSDAATGLRAIIALHSTVLGPAGGGIRFHPYATEEAALTDALRLSRAMTAKMAMGRVPMGGGKTVIIGDPRTMKTPGLLRAFGRTVENLGGRYICGEDMGVTPEDMDTIGSETRWAVGRASGSGDTSPLTSFTVFEAIRAAAAHVWGSPDVAGRVVAVQGLGAVGRRLAARLIEGGARVIGADVDSSAMAIAAEAGVEIVSVEEILGVPCDVLAPCAFGGVLSEASIPGIRAAIVCGAANNQLATSADAPRMGSRRLLYIPDYVANIGGVYSGVNGLKGKTEADAQALADKVFGRVAELLVRSEKEGITPSEAADRAVAEILANAAGRTR